MLAGSDDVLMISPTTYFLIPAGEEKVSGAAVGPGSLGDSDLHTGSWAKSSSAF